MSDRIHLADFSKDLKLYRKIVSSEVDVPALVFGPINAAGTVLGALRGTLYVKRGIRNVLDVCVEYSADGKLIFKSAGKQQDEKEAESPSSSCSSSSTLNTGIKHYKLLLMDPQKVSFSVPTCDFTYTLKEDNNSDEDNHPNHYDASLSSHPSGTSTLPHQRNTGPAVTTISRHQPASVGPFSSFISNKQLTLPLDAMNKLEKLVQEEEEKQKKKKVKENETGNTLSSDAHSWMFGVSSVRVSLTYKNYTMPELLQIVFTYDFLPPALPSSSCSSCLRASTTTNRRYRPTKVEAAAAATTSTSPSSTEELCLDISPRALAALSGFEQVGHIAHLNLRQEYLPFQYVIGQIVLDCNPTVEVVVNKLCVIASVFREFKMRIIGRRGAKTMMDLTAIDEDSSSARAELLLATVRQQGCLFRIPYDAVYWNSRLCHEHQRIIDLLQPGDVLMDVMAGVGPFAIPAAVKRVHVLANDLNPAATKYLSINAALNHTSLEVFNLDGRIFMNTVLHAYVVSTMFQRGMNKKSGRGRKRSRKEEEGKMQERKKGCSEEKDERKAHTGPLTLPATTTSTTEGSRSTSSYTYTLPPPLPEGKRTHVVMNLPAIAVEFLDVFAPLHHKEERRGEKEDEGDSSSLSLAPSPWRAPHAPHTSPPSFSSPWEKEHSKEGDGTPPSSPPAPSVTGGRTDASWLIFHVYCFSSAANILADAVLQVSHHLGYALDSTKDITEVVLVRNVAPTKRMVCVSFTLPEAFWNNQTMKEREEEEEVEGAEKKH